MGSKNVLQSSPKFQILPMLCCHKTLFPPSPHWFGQSSSIPRRQNVPGSVNVFLITGRFWLRTDNFSVLNRTGMCSNVCIKGNHTEQPPSGCLESALSICNSQEGDPPPTPKDHWQVPLDSHRTFLIKIIACLRRPAKGEFAQVRIWQTSRVFAASNWKQTELQSWFCTVKITVHFYLFFSCYLDQGCPNFFGTDSLWDCWEP